jgi:hypothetical protein
MLVARLTAVTALFVTVSCQSAQTAATTTTGTGPAAQAAPTQPTTQATTQPGAPGARRRPDPRQQEAGRANVVRGLMTQIAGREHEPAGTVFKNVQVLKTMPAGQFLQLMNEQYGRSLGFGCTGCHVAQQWDKDDRPNKVVARGMQQMVDRINGELPRIPQIDADHNTVNCGSCHKASNSPPNKLPHPDSTAAPAAALSPAPPPR